jgi:signal peptidase II
MLWATIITLFAVALDQTTKRLVEMNLKPIGDIPLIDGVLHLTYTENTGAAFGMLSGGRWFFILASALAVVGIFVYLARRTTPIHRLEMISLGMIAGGALGNLIDRLLLRYVTDFIYFKAINFAIFNVADSFVSVGAVLLGVYILFYHEKYMKAIAPHAEEPDGEKTAG